MTKKTKSELLQEFELSEHTTEFHLLEQGFRIAESELLPEIERLEAEVKRLKEEYQKLGVALQMALKG